MEAEERNVDRDDEALLKEIALGSVEAFSVLYDRFSGPLFSVVYAIVRDFHEAEEVLQDAFLRAWKRAGQFNPEKGRPFNWLVTLARSRAIDRLRRAQRLEALREAVENDALAPMPASPASGGDRESAQLIQQSLGNLPAEQRQAIQMAFLTGMTQQEIADALAVPLGTVKARIRRGMVRLRSELGGLLQNQTIE